jgi:hypothetical protein
MPGTAGVAASACEPHRTWIEAQVRLGRNAVSIYQDLVEEHGFENRYNSVKRFVARLKARAPERFDVLEFLPGEEAQVDYGQGAPTLWKPGQYRGPPVRDDAEVLGQELPQGGVEEQPGDMGAAARGGVSGTGRLSCVCGAR